MTRVGISLKLGIVSGIIWGLFFTAYYSMLPNAKFAYYSSTLCFVLLVIFVFAWPLLVRAFKEAHEEQKLKDMEKRS